MDAPSLETHKVRLDQALGNVIQLWHPCSLQVGGPPCVCVGGGLEVPSNLGHSVIMLHSQYLPLLFVASIINCSSWNEEFQWKKEQVNQLPYQGDVCSVESGWANFQGTLKILKQFPIFNKKRQQISIQMSNQNIHNLANRIFSAVSSALTHCILINNRSLVSAVKE